MELGEECSNLTICSGKAFVKYFAIVFDFSKNFGFIN